MAWRWKARRTGWNFKAGSLGFAPAPVDVENTTHIGDGTPGTLVQPQPSDVKLGVKYGGNGNEFTGTYAGGGLYLLPGDEPLDHPPSEIFQHLLINLGKGTLPSEHDEWPIFASQQVDKPDEMIAVIETESSFSGRRQTDGSPLEHYGFQIFVRGLNMKTAYQKAVEIQTALNNIWQVGITLDNSSYVIQSVTRRSGILSLGTETPQSGRWAFTLNVLAPIRKLA